MGNNLKRILVALIGIPILVLVSLTGDFIFFIVICLLSSVILYEFYRLAGMKGVSPHFYLGLAAGLFINLAFFHQKLQSAIVGILEKNNILIPFPSQTQFLYIFLTIIIIVICLTELFRNRGSALLNLSVTFFGLLYIPFFLGTFIGLRELFVPYDFPISRYFLTAESFTDSVIQARIYQWGGYTVVSILAIIWICDSAAYYIGSAIGKHKLFPRVSPNKTWEGAMAGLICAVAAALAAKFLFLEYLPVGSAVIIGVIVGTFGQLGDLAESLIKRDAGVKDSSSIIPGHGGFLDRFDSLILVSPVIYLYFDFVLFS